MQIITRFQLDLNFKVSLSVVCCTIPASITEANFFIATMNEEEVVQQQWHIHRKFNHGLLMVVL